jgi:hypothetical protein
MNFLRFLSIFVLILGFAQCKTSKVEYLSYLLYSPLILSVTPNAGSPAFSIDGTTYGPTTVVITGSNFGLENQSIITFNGTQATPSSQTETLITTTIPTGATSGPLLIKATGGTCYPDNRTGFLCSGTNFFIDCYSSMGGLYGDAIELTVGKEKSVEYSGLQTKAFRFQMPIGSPILTVTCDSDVNIKYFSSEACTLVDNGLKTNPSLTFTGSTITSTKTQQFFMAAYGATCKLKVALY